MLTTAKKSKMLSGLKDYRKKYLVKDLTDLDESGTRLMINHFLTEILGYESLEEVKTEYMIKGTYADYVVQIKGKRHFLVEVKALSLELSDKHLRQAINYGANEGIEWALLTNGKNFELYKILFSKPIESKKVLAVDLSNPDEIKQSTELLQFLHKDSVLKKGLDFLWNKHSALDAHTLAGLLYSKAVINFFKRELKKKYKSKFDDSEIVGGINKMLCEKINLENVKPIKIKSGKKKEAKEKLMIPLHPDLKNNEQSVA